MTKFITLTIAALICLSAVGCRGRQPARFNPLAGMGSPRISPPGTGTYQIPGLTAQAPTHPYYANNQLGPTISGAVAAGVNGVPAHNASHQSQVNPNPNWHSAGTMFNPANPQVPANWRQNQPGVGANSAGNLLPVNQPGSANWTVSSRTSTIGTPGTRTATNPGPVNQPRLAGMPLSDASRVVAPSQYSRSASGANQIVGSYEYTVRPQLAGGAIYTPPALAGYPANQNLVVSQSTTATPREYNQGWQQNGWRDRNAAAEPNFNR